MRSLRNHFIKDWVWFNFLGWLSGLAIGPITFLLLISPSLEFNDPLRAIFMPLFLSLPVGISIGTAQSVVLRRWKQPIRDWILALTLSSITTTAIAIWFFQNGMLGSDITAMFLVPLFAGFGIGVFQTVFLRKLIAKPILWAISYTRGLFVGIIMVLVISIVAFVSADFILDSFKSLQLWDLIFYRDEVLLMFNLLTLPIWLALVIGLPTGSILNKNFGISEAG